MPDVEQGCNDSILGALDIFLPTFAIFGLLTVGKKSSTIIMVPAYNTRRVP
jgi:hypothetical protein